MRAKGFPGVKFPKMVPAAPILPSLLEEKHVSRRATHSPIVFTVPFDERRNQLRATHPSIVKQDVALLLQKQIDVEEIDENGVVSVIAVDKGEIEASLGGNQTRQHVTGKARMKLQAGPKTQRLDVRHTLPVELILKGIHAGVRALVRRHNASGRSPVGQSDFQRPTQAVLFHPPVHEISFRWANGNITVCRRDMNSLEHF
jgi:hypothetical protein